MCVVSFIGKHYEDKWNPYNPGSPFTTPNQAPYQATTTTGSFILKPEITKAEFDALKKEVEDMKALLKKAKIYDEVNNEPNCEMESKVAFLKQVAAYVGIDLEDVFKNGK